MTDLCTHFRLLFGRKKGIPPGQETHPGDPLYWDKTKWIQTKKGVWEQRKRGVKK